MILIAYKYIVKHTLKQSTIIIYIRYISNIKYYMTSMNKKNNEYEKIQVKLDKIKQCSIAISNINQEFPLTTLETRDIYIIVQENNKKCSYN